MTDEIRVKANQTYSEIQNLDGRINTLKDFNCSGKTIQIRCDEIGTVLVEAGDYETALDFIIGILEQQKEAKEDEYRML